jgi:hypothetical protein
MIVEDSIKDEGWSKHIRKNRNFYDYSWFMKTFLFSDIVPQFK